MPLALSSPARRSAHGRFKRPRRRRQLYPDSDDEASQKKRDDARKRSVPPKRLFDPTSIKEEDLERWGISSRRDGRDRDKTVYEYEGFQFKGSFLTKFVPIRSLFTGPDVLPELEELKIFEQARPLTRARHPPSTAAPPIPSSPRPRLRRGKWRAGC